MTDWGVKKTETEMQTGGIDPARIVRMTLEYDGTRYVGWQRQLNGISVQQKVEEALSRQLGQTVKVTAAGRTDSGVHAMGQVISFPTHSTLPVRAILRGTLAFLPRDIAVVDAADAPPDFNARRSARLRWYRYYICNRSVAPAVGSAFLTHVPFKLDVAKMRAAAAALGGHHDFKAFRAVTCTATRTRLTMHEPVVTPLPDNLLVFDFKCQSFLQNMVRIMAGTITSAGRGRMTVDEIRRMLETGERVNEAVTLQPNGLFLYKVFYGGEE